MLEIRNLHVKLEEEDKVILRGVDLTVAPGETIALMGRNGAGKSTLLGALVGLVAPSSGSVRTGDAVPHRTRPRDLVRRVGTLFEAIGPVALTSNLLGARWSKLALNCAISSLGTIAGEQVAITFNRIV